MANVKNHIQYNKRLHQIFDNAKIHNERNDFIKFYEANTNLTLKEAVEAFRALENIPF